MTQRIVRISAAARELGLDKSTISRYVRAHPELLRSDGQRKGVVLDELRRHRAANVNEAKSANHIGGIEALQAAALLSPALEEPAAGAGANALPAPGSLAAERVAEARARRRLLELDLARKERRYRDVEEIAGALTDVGIAVRNRLMSLPHELADELARIQDPAEVRGCLQAALRKRLEVLAIELRRLADEEDRAADLLDMDEQRDDGGEGRALVDDGAEGVGEGRANSSAAGAAGP